jgi:hypothetical protein
MIKSYRRQGHGGHKNIRKAGSVMIKDGRKSWIVAGTWNNMVNGNVTKISFNSHTSVDPAQPVADIVPDAFIIHTLLVKLDYTRHMFIYGLFKTKNGTNPPKKKVDKSNP